VATSNREPAYRAYTVIKRDGQDDFWLALGAAFPHQDGKGFNVVLQALPIDGKIVLREEAPQDRDEPPRRRDNHSDQGRNGKGSAYRAQPRR
jgi:hypothetical protein